MNISNKPLDSIQQPHEINAEANRNITIATNTRYLNQSENKPKQTNAKKRQAFCLPQLPTKGKITKGDQIGAGGKGTVCKGKLESQDDETTDIIIKEAQTGSEKSLEKETDISQKLIENAKRRLEDENNLVSDYAGLHSVSLQHKINNQHVQRLINGSNGNDSIRKPIDGTEDKRIELYNSDIGYPNDPSQALNLACEFLAAIHSLHQQGIVHGDIKLENIMISYDKNDKCYHCTVIDLGEAGETQKDEISGLSYNSAPEAMYGRLLSPAMDIFAVGTVLCELLFGDREITYFDNNGKERKEQQWFGIFNKSSRNVFKGNYKIYTEYSYSEKKPKKAAKFLKEKLQEANKKSDGNDLYPPAIYKAIEDLIVNMCALDPNKRPSIELCLAKLTDIMLYDPDVTPKPMVVGTTSQAIDLVADLNELNEKINESAVKSNIKPSKLNKELSEVNSKLIQLKQLPRLIKKIKELKNKKKKTKHEKQQLKKLTELLSQTKHINTNNKAELAKEINNLEEKKESLLALKKLIGTYEVLIYNLQRDFEISLRDETLKQKLERAIKYARNGHTLSEKTVKTLKTTHDAYTQHNILHNLLNKLQQYATSQQITTISENIIEAIQKLQCGIPLSQETINVLKRKVSNIESRNTSSTSATI